ncbi:MAG TPA: sigma-70 family RNA polymerase sigma factor [Bryobacteraceae bacterium]|jgi:RNA polymerase sigma-70 factor (ECF subfamily)|nr:sigma-70 family RNA polymerase sigma factor [Bryobacteraceae bacterium]
MSAAANTLSSGALCMLGHSSAPWHSESALVEACLRGDDSAWETLVKQHSRLVYGLCWRFTGNSAVAEDLTQDVFLRVFRTLSAFRCAEASFATWLIRVTRNLLIDHYRRSSKDRLTQSTQEHPGLEDLIVATADHPERALAAREASDLVQSILQMLEPELRESIVYRDLEDRDYREIAVAVGIPVGTVKSRLNRGRAEFARLARRYRAAA